MDAQADPDEKRGAILHPTWFGVFVLSEDERGNIDILDKKLFSKDPKEIGQKRQSRMEGEILDEEKQIVEDLDGDLYVTSERLSVYGPVTEELELELNGEDFGFSRDLLQKALIEEGKSEIKESVEHGEHLAKAVETTQELDQTINLLKEKLKDWYSLHFPELEEELSDQEFLEAIKQHGDRENIISSLDKDIESVGGEIDQEVKAHYQNLARIIDDQVRYRDELHAYIEETMERYAPNITKVTGAKLGAELIAAAGSLKDLAKKPSSTIQVFGAEKSLFKHLEKGTPPPKHGLILQHPFVHRTDPGLRGKVARKLANKIAIAARIDYFSDKDKGDELRSELEKKIKEIRR